ncbi:hypothetical protein BKH40_05815 [Helicobacter sp. 11S02629-2]|nr:hypothetical protein BKH40_05815 [Helicobacter sp. 11S02629-2]
MCKSFLRYYWLFESRHVKDTRFSLDIFSKRDYIFVFLVLSCILCITLSLKYKNYLALQDTKRIEAKVILQYPKDNKTIFKLKTKDGFNLYTIEHTPFESLKDLRNKDVQILGKANKCSFLDSFKSCFFINMGMAVMPTSFGLLDLVYAQHKNSLLGNLHAALFLGDSLDPALRHLSNSLGLAHIIAISGFHLGVLSLMLYIFFMPIYRIFQARFYPHRNAYFDIGALILACMGGYLVLLDFQPSFFRAFLMASFAFFLLFSGLKIVSFYSLMLCALFALSLDLSLAFNIGFLLSVAGVFYIFLFIKYVKTKSAFLTLVLFNLLLFLQMMPVVHYFFPYFSPFQLVSIPVGLAFVLFFPLSLFLHLVGLGGSIDSLLLPFLDMKFFLSEFYTPLSLLLAYLALSFISIFYKNAYYILCVFTICFYSFNLWVYVKSLTL